MLWFIVDLNKTQHKCGATRLKVWKKTETSLLHKKSWCVNLKWVTIFWNAVFWFQISENARFQKSLWLPNFHCFSGCDFMGIRKKLIFSKLCQKWDSIEYIVRSAFLTGTFGSWWESPKTSFFCSNQFTLLPAGLAFFSLHISCSLFFRTDLPIPLPIHQGFFGLFFERLACYRCWHGKNVVNELHEHSKCH